MSSHLESLNFDANSEIHKNAKDLRQRLTNTEIILWKWLRNRKFKRYKFRRQHPINQFIADFYCHEKKIVIEIDGEYHLSKKQQEEDDNRSAEMERWGIKIIRFTNEEIEKDLTKVLTTIVKECELRESYS